MVVSLTDALIVDAICVVSKSCCALDYVFARIIEICSN